MCMHFICVLTFSVFMNYAEASNYPCRLVKSNYIEKSSWIMFILSNK